MIPLLSNIHANNLNRANAQSNNNSTNHYNQGPGRNQYGNQYGGMNMQGNSYNGSQNRQHQQALLQQSQHGGGAHRNDGSSSSYQTESEHSSNSSISVERRAPANNSRQRQSNPRQGQNRQNADGVSPHDAPRHGHSHNHGRQPTNQISRPTIQRPTSSDRNQVVSRNPRHPVTSHPAAATVAAIALSTSHTRPYSGNVINANVNGRGGAGGQTNSRSPSTNAVSRAIQRQVSNTTRNLNADVQRPHQHSGSNNQSPAARHVREHKFSMPLIQVNTTAIKRPFFSSKLYMCQICLEGFDTDTQLPMSLNCGHTICLECLSNMMRGTTLIKCPFDNKQYRYEGGVKYIGKNFSLITLIEDEERQEKEIARQKGEEKALIEKIKELQELEEYQKQKLLKVTEQIPIFSSQILAAQQYQQLKLQEQSASKYFNCANQSLGSPLAGPPSQVIQQSPHQLLGEQNELSATSAIIGHSASANNINQLIGNAGPNMRSPIGGQVEMLEHYMRESMICIENAIAKAKLAKESVQMKADIQLNQLKIHLLQIQTSQQQDGSLQKVLTDTKELIEQQSRLIQLGIYDQTIRDLYKLL
ncbi:hypothetical protein FGO68_gene12948 [Halteria grandinella]|uniref:RING-type domain-containing protein n=1 Tax=Halteria grandinella TaxID=5974 RepID=A0A8J8NXV9_HALGN|nr:hypothetical protein FGO68_gene12948 [Halteria grandinella]